MHESQRRSAPAAPLAGGPAAGGTPPVRASHAWGKRVRRKLRSLALEALALPLVPPALVGVALRAAAPFAGRSRAVRTLRANLALAGAAAGVVDARALERAVLRHAALQFVSWVRLSRARGAWVLAAVRTTPEAEQALQALLGGQGAIVATAHLGEWELLAAYLARRGVQGGVIGLERREDPTSAWLARLRAANGVATHAHDGPPRALLAELAAGRVLGILTDLETPRSDQVLLPFLGVPAHCASAPAALARASGRPIVPLVCVREGGTWTIHASPALRFERQADRAGEERRLLLELNAVYAAWIRRWPEQWAWHQPRWRRQGAARQLLD